MYEIANENVAIQTLKKIQTYTGLHLLTNICIPRLLLSFGIKRNKYKNRFFLMRYPTDQLHTIIMSFSIETFKAAASSIKY